LGHYHKQGKQPYVLEVLVGEGVAGGGRVGIIKLYPWLALA
jgi:hypothetical protein